uniref:Uncharacterized protein n=1 Tax=Aegilops tauschii TaxID=37682 RepID=M8CZB6_AEGTA
MSSWLSKEVEMRWWMELLRSHHDHPIRGESAAIATDSSSLQGPPTMSAAVDRIPTTAEVARGGGAAPVGSQCRRPLGARTGAAACMANGIDGGRVGRWVQTGGAGRFVAETPENGRSERGFFFGRRSETGL